MTENVVNDIAEPTVGRDAASPPNTPGRRTNWWALIALGSVALAIAFVIRSNRPQGRPLAQKEMWAELRDQAAFLRDRGRLSEAIQVSEAAVELARTAFGPNHFTEAESLNLLGLILTDAARYDDAVTAFEGAIPLIQQLFGPMSKEMAQTGSNLGLTLMKMGNHEEATDIFGKALEIIESTSGPDSLEAALAINNLAVSLDTSGDHEAAKSLHTRALGIRRRGSGPASLITAESKANLAHSLLEIDEQYFRASPSPADEPTETSTDRHRRDTGFLREAKRLFEQSLAVRERLLPPDSLEIANTLSGLARLARLDGRLDDAGLLSLQALAVRQSKLGIDHPTTATSLDVLATVRLAEGSFEEAEELYLKALDIRSRRLGVSHPKTLASLDALAAFQIDRKQNAAAEKSLRKALEIREAANQGSSPAIVPTLESLATVLRAADRESDAKAIDERIQTIRTEDAARMAAEKAVTAEQKGSDPPAATQPATEDVTPDKKAEPAQATLGGSDAG